MAIALPLMEPPSEQDRDDFVQWMDGLNDAERGDLALDFLALLKTATGAVRSQTDASPGRAPIATVQFDGITALENWAYANRWPTVRARLTAERAEAQWEAMQARYAA